jgi:hypothetical protein
MTASFVTPAHFNGTPVWTRGAARPTLDRDDMRFARIVSESARFQPQGVQTIITFGHDERGLIVHRGSLEFSAGISADRPVDWSLVRELVDICAVQLRLLEIEKESSEAERSEGRSDDEAFLDVHAHWPWEASV